jgi:hypothetical protein
MIQTLPGLVTQLVDALHNFSDGVNFLGKTPGFQMESAQGRVSSTGESMARQSKRTSPRHDTRRVPVRVPQRELLRGDREVVQPRNHLDVFGKPNAAWTI